MKCLVLSFRKLPLAAESLFSSSGTSPVTSQQTPSPTSTPSPLFSSASNSLSYTATFPQSTSTAGVFSIRDPPQPLATFSAPGKARNGTHKASHASKDVQDSAVAESKKRRNASYSPSALSSSSSSTSSSLFPAVDSHKRNGSSCHKTVQGSGGAVVSPAKKKGLGRGGSGLWRSAGDWLPRSDASQSHNSHNRCVSTKPFSR